MTLPIFKGQVEADETDGFDGFWDDELDDGIRLKFRPIEAAANFCLKLSENDSTGLSGRRGDVIFGCLSAMNCDATGREFCIRRNEPPNWSPNEPPNLCPPNDEDDSPSTRTNFGSMSFKKRLGLLNSIFP